MKYPQFALLLLYICPLTASSQQVQQLKAEKYQVSIHTQFVPGSSTPLQQVTNITLLGKPLDAASVVTSAQIQITMQPAPPLPPFFNAGAKSIVIYAGSNYYSTVMDLVDRAIEQKKFTLLVQFVADAATNTASADLLIKK